MHPSLGPWAAIVALITLTGGSSWARADEVTTHTVYDDEASAYVTRGRVRLKVPFETLTRVAGAFEKYRAWTLLGINGDKANSREFITLLRDVTFRRGGPRGRGYFDVRFDIDLLWPFGSEGNSLHFDIRRAVYVEPRAERRVRTLEIGLMSDSMVLDTFSLRLEASGDAAGSEVRFTCRVRFVSLIDTFFSMSRYRYNVEWRIIKVIQNLKAYVERTSERGR